MANTGPFGFFSRIVSAVLAFAAVLSFRIPASERIYRTVLEPLRIAFPPPTLSMEFPPTPAPARVLFRDQVRAFTAARLARHERHNRAPLSMAFASC